MAYDYTQNKTPIFTGINDNPVQADSTQGSNASDLIAKVNQTLDWLNQDLQASQPPPSLVIEVDQLLGTTTGTIGINSELIYIVHTPYIEDIHNTNFKWINSNDILFADTIPRKNVPLKIDITNKTLPFTIDLTEYVKANGTGFYLPLVGDTNGNLSIKENLGSRYFKLKDDGSGGTEAFNFLEDGIIMRSIKNGILSVLSMQDEFDTFDVVVDNYGVQEFQFIEVQDKSFNIKLKAEYKEQIFQS